MAASPHRSAIFVALTVLAAIGAFIGVWLTLAHVDYALGYKEGTAQVCHLLADSGCAVTVGRFGAVAGIPVATIGLAGMTAVLVLSIRAWLRRRNSYDPTRGVILVLAVISVLVSALMFVASLLEGSFCPFCVAWYVVNALVLVCAWFGRDREVGWSDLFDELAGSSGLLAIVAFGGSLLLGIFVHQQWYEHLKAKKEADIAAHAQEIAAEMADTMFAGTPVEVDLPHAPRKGPRDAAIEMVEIADFQCPFCRSAWFELRRAVELTERSVAVRFVHFPLDSTCNPIGGDHHPFACAAAVAAVCAQRQEKFWEMGDLLFENQDDLERSDLVEYARAIEIDVEAFETCLDDPAALAAVQADIAWGRSIDVGGTPTILLNGYRLEGRLVAPILVALFERVAERTQ